MNNITSGNTNINIVSNHAVVVTYPILTEFPNKTVLNILAKRAHAAYPPIGALIVASSFINLGWQVSLVDTNEEYLKHIRNEKEPASFCEALASRLTDLKAFIYGFSTIGSSYYITLLTAKYLKKASPEAIILLGGPQASVTAAETLTVCPYIDYVLAGETDESLTFFLDRGLLYPENIPGLAYRQPSGKIRTNIWPEPPSCDQMLVPAFNLWKFRDENYISIEAGRGCPNYCKFCSTSRYFGRRHRLKSPHQLISEVLALQAKYGKRDVKFIHDNMFVSRHQLSEFCHAWTSERDLSNVHWSCSLRPDFLTSNVIGLLSLSNCEAVFLGIETGSSRMQQIIGKNLDIANCKTSLELLHQARIRATVSYIIGFPEEEILDFQKTLELYSESLLTPSAQPQVALLSPVSGSVYCDQNKQHLQYDRTFSQMAHQGPPINKDHEDFLLEFPELFPAHYSIPLHHMDRSVVADCGLFLSHAQATFRWLLSAIVLHTNGLPRIVLLWQQFNKRNLFGKQDRTYYASHKFQEDFIAFCRDTIVREISDPQSYTPLLSLVSVYHVDKSEIDMLQHMNAESHLCKSMKENDVLVNCTITKDIEFSYSEMLSFLVNRKKFRGLSKSPCNIGIYLDRGMAVVEELSPLSAQILRKVEYESSVYTVVTQLIEEDVQYLPDNIENIEAGYAFAIESMMSCNMLRIK